MGRRDSSAWIRSACGAAIVAASIVGGAASARADVVATTPAGFSVRTAVQVAVPPERAYQALLQVGAWWNGDHTYSGDAKNLSIAPQAGGCFCERLPNGGAVEHGRVVNLVPGSLLRVQGALGPLQELAVTGSLTWQIAAGEAGKGSTITMTYVVGGYAPGGLEKLAPVVDQVLGQQVQSLKAYLDKSR